jgi:tripartite-type tricarboxylate transporter receptor subunit TctC
MPAQRFGWAFHAILVFSVVRAASAQADVVADFYRGKELRMIVSTTTGTGYDTYARAVARHLPRHIPGHPAIIVQNMPGAGGITAANYIYSVAPADGTVVRESRRALRSHEAELARHADHRGRALHRLPHVQG